jgi:hypothetical protein
MKTWMSFLARATLSMVAMVMVLAGEPSPARAAGEAAAAKEKPFFPIMAWDMVRDDPAALKQMHDCGFTVAGFCRADQLDAVAAAGMKAIVSDPRTRDYDWTNVDPAVAKKNVESLVAEVGKHPAVFGYYLRDEPSAGMFDGLETVADEVRRLAPGKWPYINLFPNYATAEQLQAKTYEHYLDRFVATCKPPVLSYDHYALMGDGSLGKDYFRNLEQMRATAIKNKIPFWNIVAGVATFDFRAPTDADFRLQAYTTLAYGGRGISYFTYFTPDVGNYRMGAVDQFGHKTATWDVLRNVNLQIQTLAPTMLQLTSDRVYHVGTVPPGGHGPGEESLVTAVAGGDYCVGDFTHADGTSYVMIVNRSTTASAACAPTFRKPVKQALRISPYSASVVPFTGENIWLAPGQGVLLKLER